MAFYVCFWLLWLCLVIQRHLLDCLQFQGGMLYIFFVISGFLVASNISKFDISSMNFNSLYLFPFHYFYYRWSRLYPFYFFAFLFSLLIICFGSYLIGYMYGPLSYWSSISFAQMLIISFSHFSLIGLNFLDSHYISSPQFWTLSVELNFYFVIAVLYSLFYQLGSYRPRFNLPVLFYLIVALVFFNIEFIFADSRGLLYGFHYFLYVVCVWGIRSNVNYLRPVGGIYLRFFFFIISCIVILFGGGIDFIAPYVFAITFLLGGVDKTRFDELLGNLSYLIYLIHIPVMLILSFLIGRRPLEIYSDNAIMIGVASVTLFALGIIWIEKRLGAVYWMRSLNRRYVQ